MRVNFTVHLTGAISQQHQPERCSISTLVMHCGSALPRLQDVEESASLGLHCSLSWKALEEVCADSEGVRGTHTETELCGFGVRSKPPRPTRPN